MAPERQQYSVVVDYLLHAEKEGAGTDDIEKVFD